MSSNEANHPSRRSDKDREEILQRPDEVLSFMSKSMDFIKELMEDNERLRYRAVQLQEENRELFKGGGANQRADLLRQQLLQLENERLRLLTEYQKVEEANKAFASRYVGVEEENNNLANLYVCSFQLHSTLDFKEVIQVIMEIIINLIGAEEFGIFLFDEKTNSLKPAAMEGPLRDAGLSIKLGEGVIGRAAVRGENFYDPAINSEQAHQSRAIDEPIVCIPLVIKDRTIGVIALYKLLPQKNQFANIDYELFTLLAGHAATAIFSAKLYSEAQRKLHTIKGFMELLTSSET